MFLKKFVATLSLLTVAFAGVGAANAGEVFVENYDFIRDSRTETDLSIHSESELDGYRVYGSDAEKVYYEAGYSTVSTYKHGESGDYTESYQHTYHPYGHIYSFDGERLYESASTYDYSYFNTASWAQAWERGAEKYSNDTTVRGTINTVDTEWGSGHRTSAGVK